MSDIIDCYVQTQSKRGVHFSEKVVLHETYSTEEYDRKNGEMPSLEIQVNAGLFGGWWAKRLQNIYFDLNYLKRTEMKWAYNNTIENIKIIEQEKKNNTI